MTSSIGSQLISISLSAHTYCIICSSYKKHLPLPPSPCPSHVWQLSEEGGDAVTALQWNPNPSHQLVAAAVGNVVVLIATGTGMLQTDVMTTRSASYSVH